MTTAVEPSVAPATRRARRAAPISDAALRRRVDEILHRRPTVGLAVGVIRVGQPPLLISRGLADVSSRSPITEDTVFRIGSVTKLFTAIAVMQLAEQGRIELDAPANDYLRAYRLIPEQAGWRPATVRHLLTHTAGIPDVRRTSDLLRADPTPAGGRPAMLSVKAGDPLPSLADYYGRGLRVVVEPGSTFTYSNHGFATLGQIVEDVTGMSLDRCLRTAIFEPLGMTGSDLSRSDRNAPRLAIGYAIGRTGPRAVPDRDWIGAGGGGIYSTARDMARFATAVLAGASEPGAILEHDAILEPASLATMFDAHHQPDARVPGMGLAFFRHQVGGHRVVAHDGILPGFNAALMLAPDDGIGLFALTNGSSAAFAWLPVELTDLLRELLGAPEVTAGARAPHHPEIWADLCGRYVFPPRISDLRMRLMLGGGAQVFVGDGRLKVRLLIPIPAAYRGFPLEPDDPQDPEVFRIDPSQVGMAPIRVVFSRVPGGPATAAHTDLGGMPVSLLRRPGPSDAPAPTRWWWRALAVVVAAGLTAMVRRGRRQAGTHARDPHGSRTPSTSRQP